jgi:phage tail-like protein
MALPRPFALMHTTDQWCRAAHLKTAVESLGVVRLALLPETEDAGPPGLPQPPAGLAFDPWCRLFHSVPEEGRVERELWQVFADPLKARQDGSEPLDIFATPLPPAAGDFEPVEDAEGVPAGPLDRPLGLATDEEGRLFVAEAGARRVLVYDLRERRLLRRLHFPRPEGGFHRPLDLAGDGRRVWALCEDNKLFSFEARGDARELSLSSSLPPGLDPASRLAIDPASGALYLLTAAGTAGATVIFVDPQADPPDPKPLPWASDLEIERPAGAGAEPALVVARRPGQDLLRLDRKTFLPADKPFLKARLYDGRGIVAAPGGRIAFWTAQGPRLAVQPRERFEREGRVITYRLDSGVFETRWGRLFLDACIPRDCQLTCFFATADEIPEGPELPRSAPDGGLPIPAEKLLGESPPMPPEILAPGPDAAGQRLHRRSEGASGCRELPWTPPPSGAFESFETYEAPVAAPPGRYLWVFLELRGKGSSTPRIKSLRAEHPGHDLMRRLPRVYSRDAASADFLRRYLAPIEGFVGELDALQGQRRALLDPWSVPAELLPWLGSLLGLVLDQRWSVASRRLLIAEAAWLFRFRGTLQGLRRLLEIYLGRQPILVEHYRLRGLGGSILGAEGGLASTAVVGGGLRVGVDVEASAPDKYAHRFTVVVPARLSAEQMAVLEDLLEEHKPAHTLFEICAVDAGLRAGVGLYLGVSSLVGKTAAFTELQVGGSLLGKDAVLGRPTAGVRPGGSRVGAGSEVG